MARQTFDINFYCRKGKASKITGLAPVELSIVINGERCYVHLQRKERPKEFEAAKNSKKDNEIKRYCERQRRLVYKIADDMADAEIELTAKNLKECLKKGGVSNFYTLGQLWDNIMFNKEDEQSTGDLTENTLSKYKLARKAFYQANGLTDTFPAKDITKQHIIKMQNYLRGQKMQQNTIYQYHAKCKAAFSLAFETGKIKSNPYAGYKINKGEKKEVVWLLPDEMEQIRDKCISIERLAQVRDLFVFQCNSGLSYADLAGVKETDFQVNDLNQTFIQKKRKKTGQRYLAIILHDGVAVLKKYNYRLPLLSNQKYNAYLKEIQVICGVDKTLHTHLARTTYICFLYNNGITPQEIAEIVGHYACTTTLKYYTKMENSTLFNAFRKSGIANKEKSKTIKPDSQAPSLP